MIENITKLTDDGKKVFSLIQKLGPISKSEIILMTNLKLTTLNRVLKNLLEKKLIVEATIGESTGGRRPVLYDGNPSKYYLLGIDISRTYFEVVLTNMKIKPLKEKRVFIDESFSAVRTFDTILKIVNTFIEELGISKESIIGAGLGTVGPVDRDNGRLLKPVPFLSSDWDNISITMELEDRLKVPVMLESGANTAVLGEAIFGEGSKYKNIAYINCGIGIRTGIIASNKLIRTINHEEDAFGHMTIDIDGKKCWCGNYGCLESYASIPAIVNKFKGELKKGKTTSIERTIDEIHYKDIFEAAEKGDPLAEEVVIEAALYFGAGLANYINLLDPELVILSGPTINYSHLFFKKSSEAAQKRCRDKNSVTFSKGGEFKELAIALGSATMVMEHYLGRL